MAPPRRTAGPSNETPEEAIQDLAAANAEIEQLRALLAIQETPSGTETLSPDRLTNVLEAIAQRLTREDSLTPSTKSAKISDPPLLTDGKDPTFES
jgi:hypothetical protein